MCNDMSRTFSAADLALALDPDDPPLTDGWDFWDDEVDRSSADMSSDGDAVASGQENRA